MDKINFGGFQFGASLEGEEPRSPGDPFRILLIGDFGGDNQNASPTPAKIDRDTLDEVMSSIAPRVDRLLTTFDGLPIAFNPTSLDDFHPDQLFESMDIFAEMRKLKRQLKNGKDDLSIARGQAARPNPQHAIEDQRRALPRGVPGAAGGSAQSQRPDRCDRAGRPLGTPPASAGADRGGDRPCPRRPAGDDLGQDEFADRRRGD